MTPDQRHESGGRREGDAGWCPFPRRSFLRAVVGGAAAAAAANLLPTGQARAQRTGLRAFMLSIIDPNTFTTTATITTANSPFKSARRDGRRRCRTGAFPSPYPFLGRGSTTAMPYGWA